VVIAPGVVDGPVPSPAAPVDRWRHMARNVQEAATRQGMAWCPRRRLQGRREGGPAAHPWLSTRQAVPCCRADPGGPRPTPVTRREHARGPLARCSESPAAATR
jgi:hypothetical protein